jgi:hypothetical protein
MGKEEGGRKFGNGSVTDVTDVRKKEEGGRRRKEQGKNSYSFISDFRVVNTGNWEGGIGKGELGMTND